MSEQSHPGFQLPQVKVCGLARAEDAHAAHAAGASALGAVHYPPSPRSVSPEEMARIFADLPADLLKVGVIVDLDRADAEQLLTRGGANAVQLCGSERAEDWQDFAVPILRRIPVDASGAAEIEAWRGVASGFVLDHPKTAGGSGQAVDFPLAAQLAAMAPCLLAGGLSAGLAAEAIATVRPAGVDASSRLEQAPGRKNPAAVLAFVKEAQSAFRRLAEGQQPSPTHAPGSTDPVEPSDTDRSTDTIR